MSEDRKYSQRGYQDGGPRRANEPRNEPGAESALGRFAPPRHPLDITAPRLPRLVRNVAASRCYDCANALPAGFDFALPCPKCSAPLRCCKQCAHFDSAAHFQCVQPVPERIAAKAVANACEFFSPRVTVARDSSPPAAPPNRSEPAAAPHVSRSSSKAREAFENLFKK